MADTEALQDTLFKEMKGRIKEDDSTVPAPDGAYAYFTSYVTGGQHPRICRQPRDGGEATVLLDGDAMAAGKPFFSLGAAVWSHDHRLMAYAFDDKGSEFFKIKLRDLETGQELADEVPDMEGAPVWNADGTAFYYTRVDEHRRPLQVLRHRVGTDAAQDELIYQEPDSGFFTRVARKPGPPLRHRQHGRSRDERSPAAGFERARQGPAARRTARDQPRISGRAARRPPHHPHQRGRRGGLQDRGSAA